MNSLSDHSFNSWVSQWLLVTVCSETKCGNSLPRAVPTPGTNRIEAPRSNFDVVFFFHGLQIAGGDQAWKTTWSFPKAGANGEDVCWPRRDWLPQDFKKIRVLFKRFLRCRCHQNLRKGQHWGCGGHRGIATQVHEIVSPSSNTLNPLLEAFTVYSF